MALLNRSCSVGFIYESSVVAGCHEHLDTDDVQDPELVRLQPSAELAWFFSAWFDPEMSWEAEVSGRRGRQQTYSDAAIQPV